MVIQQQGGPSGVSGIQCSASFTISKEACGVGGIAYLGMSTIMADISTMASSARAFQLASYSPNPRTGLGILSEYRGNESAEQSGTHTGKQRMFKSGYGLLYTLQSCNHATCSEPWRASRVGVEEKV